VAPAGRPASPPPDPFAAACAFERALLRRAAGEVVDLPGLGTGFRTPAVPLHHAVNGVRITAQEATATAIADAADDVLPASPTGSSSWRTARSARGWRRDSLHCGYRGERHVLMALRRPRDREPEPGLAREASEAELEAVEAATTREAPHGAEPAVVAALTAGRRRLHAAAPGTRYVVGAVDGTHAAHATLYAEGAIAQVEDVATLAAFRGRGLARAVVSLACDLAAGHPLVFLVADDDDWPKDLYARLGFDPVGLAWAFTRLPAPAR
jgi:ribosomal protein S18 acetylase RimI-like enzyme